MVINNPAKQFPNQLKAQFEMIPTAGLKLSASAKSLGEIARFCRRFRLEEEEEDEGGVTVACSACGSYQRKREDFQVKS